MTFVGSDGEEMNIKVPIGMSMLEAAHENDIELEGKHFKSHDFAYLHVDALTYLHVDALTYLFMIFNFINLFLRGFKDIGIRSINWSNCWS